MTDQGNLFGGAQATVERLDLADADVVFHPALLTSPDRDRLLAEIGETVIWQQEALRMYGKETPIPRLTAWYGDPGAHYTYSGIANDPAPWTSPIAEILDVVQRETDAEFNCVLLNLYRDGSDSVSWHSDDEREFGHEPVIASVSLGATRKFQFRRKADPKDRVEIELTHGSLLVMRGRTQQSWQHQIPKTARPVEPRVNLTFRKIS